MEKIQDTVDGSGGGLDQERALSARRSANLKAMNEALMGYLMGSQEDPKNVYKVGLGSVPFLHGIR